MKAHPCLHAASLQSAARTQGQDAPELCLTVFSAVSSVRAKAAPASAACACPVNLRDARSGYQVTLVRRHLAPDSRAAVAQQRGAEMGGG